VILQTRIVDNAVQFWAEFAVVEPLGLGVFSKTEVRGVLLAFLPRCPSAIRFSSLAGGKNVFRFKSSHSLNELPNLSAQQRKRGISAVIEVTGTKSDRKCKSV
jgi:hypothetical protein